MIDELMGSCLSHFSSKLNWIDAEGVSFDTKLDALYAFIEIIKSTHDMNPAAKLILTEMAFQKIYLTKAKEYYN